MQFRAYLREQGVCHVTLTSRLGVYTKPMVYRGTALQQMADILAVGGAIASCRRNRRPLSVVAASLALQNMHVMPYAST